MKFLSHHDLTVTVYALSLITSLALKEQLGEKVNGGINLFHITQLKAPILKALSHGAIFLATCNAILLLVDVKLANTRFHHSLLIYS